jgi:type 1 fimbriae regulatory protein FimE
MSPTSIASSRQNLLPDSGHRKPIIRGEGALTVPKTAVIGKVVRRAVSLGAQLHAVPGPALTIENGKVAPPRRVPNRARGTREHLVPTEVDPLTTAAGRLGRHGHRDATLILLAYRHGLRVSELVALRWEQIDLRQGLLRVARLKNGVASVHPLRGPELRALRRLSRDYDPTSYVFTTERRGPLTASAVRKIVARAGVAAALGFPVHPHMLRRMRGPRPLSGAVPIPATEASLFDCP